MPGTAVLVVSAVPGGCTRGGGLGGPGGVLYRVPSRYPPRTGYIQYLVLRPYPRPNEGLSEASDEVSEIGSRKGPE